MIPRKIICSFLALITIFLCACNGPEAPETTSDTETENIEASSAMPDESTAAPEPEFDYETLPRTVYGGAWETSHVQGIAIDENFEYMYFSFTSMLVKTDMEGNVVGTVTGLPGHLGDLDYNPEDGRVYGSLEVKSSNAFYIAVFDCDKITKAGINCMAGDVMKVVPLPEVSADFTATVGNNKYRYGCSGIDGVAFGPDFGADPASQSKLMVAYGIFKDNNRKDNDYQVILSYDWKEFSKHEISYSQIANAAGAESENRYFVYTGNTNYGVQNLEYDPASELWLMAVYRGEKPDFPNYALFAVEGSAVPVEGEILGQPTPENGLLLPLADMGLKHGATGIRGWNFSHADTGIIALGGGYFYISNDAKIGGKQDCTATLYKWTGEDEPFKKVN